MSHVSREEGGKPYYDPHTGQDEEEKSENGNTEAKGLEFNISHHGRLVVLAGAPYGGSDCLKRRRVGIDVTKMDVVKDTAAVASQGSWQKWARIYADVFSAGEITRIVDGEVGDDLQRRLRRFYAHWALKEAYVKLGGEGLSATWLQKVEFRRVGGLRKGEGEYGRGEVVRDVEVWVEGIRRTDVGIELEALGEEYIVATIVDSKDEVEILPPFEEVDFKRDILPLARKPRPVAITVGVLALQGAFHEHLQLLRDAQASIPIPTWTFVEVRNALELASCDALIIPGGESTTMSLVAARSGLLEPLREFVKVLRKPTWGTCAGLILLAEAANRTKKGGQDLIGGLDVRVSRNHFGRQVESFEADLELPFLGNQDHNMFRAIFIRAPVVEKVLDVVDGEQVAEKALDDTVVAPSKKPVDDVAAGVVGHPVEIMATLPGRKSRLAGALGETVDDDATGDIVAVRQGNVFGTSFHPELTKDPRIHVWWLRQVKEAFEKRFQDAGLS